VKVIAVLKVQKTLGTRGMFWGIISTLFSCSACEGTKRPKIGRVYDAVRTGITPGNAAFGTRKKASLPEIGGTVRNKLTSESCKPNTNICALLPVGTLAIRSGREVS